MKLLLQKFLAPGEDGGTPAPADNAPATPQDTPAGDPAPSTDNTPQFIPEQVEEWRRTYEDYQSKQAEIAEARRKFEEERTQIEAQRREAADAIQFQRALAANPEVAQAVREAVAAAITGKRGGPQTAADIQQAYDDAGMQVPPQIAQAITVLAQHGQLTQKQLAEVQKQTEEARKATEELSTFRRQQEARLWESEVRAQVADLKNKYPQQFRYARDDEVIRAALEHPDEARQVGITNLMKADADAMKGLYDRWRAEDEKARQTAATDNTLPLSGGSTAPAPSSRRAMTHEDRMAAMTAALEKYTSGAAV